MSALGPTSVAVQIAFAAVVLILTGLTVWRWRRWGRPLRAVALIVVQASLILAALVRINASEQLMTTWAAVAGSTGDLTTSVMDQQAAVPVTTAMLANPTPTENAWQVSPAQQAADRSAAGSSTVESITLAGSTTGYQLPAQIYLPGGYASQPARSYPVVELLDGYPGSPDSWIGTLNLKDTLDHLIAAGQIPPVIAVLPSQNPDPGHDSECVDATAGYKAQADTYLSKDVPAYVMAHYRAASGRINWVIGGYSTGGYGASSVGLRHTDFYGSVISLSGYVNPIQDNTTGTLFASRSDKHDFSVTDLLDHPHQPMALYLIAANDNIRDRKANLAFAAHVPATDSLRSIATATGGHSFPVWATGFTDAIQWLAGVNQAR